MNLKETYDQIAEDWNKDHQTDDWWVEGTNKFASFLKPGDAILDVGCGSGHKSKYLIQKGFKVLGIDLSDKMIEIAKREVPEGKFQVLDLNDINKLDQSFDAIFMQAVLLHVPKSEARAKLAEIAHKLKPHGYFYIAVKERRPGRPEEEIVTENDYGYDYQRFFSYYTLDEIKGHFTNLGFKVIHEDVYNSGKRGWAQVIAEKN